MFFPGGISHGYVGLFSGRDLENNDATRSNSNGMRSF